MLAFVSQDLTTIHYMIRAMNYISESKNFKIKSNNKCTYST